MQRAAVTALEGRSAGARRLVTTEPLQGLDRDDFAFLDESSTREAPLVTPCEREGGGRVRAQRRLRAP
jgi:hypothetical protein